MSIFPRRKRRPATSSGSSASQTSQPRQEPTGTPYAYHDTSSSWGGPSSGPSSCDSSSSDSGSSSCGGD